MAVTSSRNLQFEDIPVFEIGDPTEKQSQQVSNKYLVVLIGFYILIAYLTITIANSLPHPVKEEHDANTFSEMSAKTYLDTILGNQPRVAGTPFHFANTMKLKISVDDISRLANIPVHTDWQYANGDYWLPFKQPNLNVYRNVSNIIAVLEGESGFNEDGTIGSSILINCHYDSVPFAIGASDDGVFCAVLVETLDILSQRKTKLKHNVIFLFNGAEENVLLGSHGFLSHPWSKGVISVVNLDSAGMNGRPFVFQVTDPRVLDIYKKTTTRPTAQGIGQFLFDTGLIPSDTDFRIWRDFGHFKGIDIAFIKWGHVYHTRNDRPELIQDGVIQNAGNTILDLVRGMADSAELNVDEPPATAVFFDYLGLFLITYSQSVSLLVDVAVGMLGLLSVGYYLRLFGFRCSLIYELLWSLVGRIACMVVGAANVAVFTIAMITMNWQLRYLSQHWTVVPFYWITYLVASVATSHAFDFWRTKKVGLSHSIRTAQAMSSTRLLMALILLALTCVPTLANLRYIITILLLLMSTSSIVTMTAIRYGRLKASQHLLLEIVLNLPATMFSFSIAENAVSLLIPIMGRSSNDFPDGIIASLNTILTIISVCTVSGIELLFSRRQLWKLLSGISIVCVVIMVIPFNPYRLDQNVTQRHYWFHTQVTSYDKNLTPINSNSGVLIAKTDVYNIDSAISAIKESDFYINNNKDVEGNLRIADSDMRMITDVCNKLLYCNMPLFRPRFEKLMHDSLFVKMAPPANFTHSLTLANRSCVGDQCSLSFVINGPAYNTIVIWPRSNVTVSKWSFETPIKELLVFQERPVYTIYQVTPTYPSTHIFEPLEFNINLSVPTALQSHILVDISYNAHKIYEPLEFTDEYRQLLAAMPDYFNIATFLSFRNNYVF